MSREEEKNTGYKVLEGLAIAALVIVLVFVLQRTAVQKDGVGFGSVTELADGWYRLEDGARIEVTLPAEIEQEGEVLTLYNDSLTEEWAGAVITTRGAMYEMQMLLEDQVLYTYTDKAFPRNDQMKSKLDCDGTLPTDFTGGTLALRYFGQQGESYRIARVYVGSGAAVMQYHYRQSALNLAIVFFMAIFAVASIVIAVYLYRIKLFDPRFLDVAFFLLICGIWCATDSSIIQQYNSYTPAICVVSFYAFMLLAVPMLHFVRNTGDMKKYRVIDLFIALFYGNAVVQGILNMLGVFEFVEMLFVTHLLLAAGVVVVSALLVKENRRQEDREKNMILLAFVLLGASGVLAMILYWLLEIPYYGAIFECGIVIFVAILFSIITVTMAGNIKFKIETLAYQRLALEDRLTGMPNRRAFEEFMRDFQWKAETYKDAALIFVNLVRLREINDAFGSNAGNELVIALARCMENAFGNMGTCFRLDGDEFGAVLPDPDGTCEAWFARLEQEIQTYNNSSRYKINVIRGCASLRDEEGRLRTVSDWKYRADRDMYESGEEKGNV